MNESLQLPQDEQVAKAPVISIGEIAKEIAGKIGIAAL